MTATIQTHEEFTEFTKTDVSAYSWSMKRGVSGTVG